MIDYLSRCSLSHGKPQVKVGQLTGVWLLLVAMLAGAAGCRREAPESYIRITRSDGTPVSAEVSSDHLQPPATSAAQTGETRTAEQRVGLALYPGAEVVADQVLVGPSGEVAGAELTTRQPYHEVVKFYREHYQVQRPRLQTRQQPQRQTTLGWQDREANYTIVIKQDPARHCTVINLAASRHNRPPRPADGITVPPVPEAATPDHQQ